MRSTTKFYFKKPSLIQRIKNMRWLMKICVYDLFKRVKETRWMMKHCGYDLVTAWRRAGMVL